MTLASSKERGSLAAIVIGVAGFAWAGAVALECARHLWAGQSPGWDTLTRAHMSWENLVVLPIMAGVMLIDWWAQGPGRKSFASYFPQTRYDLFFVMADATGAMSLLVLAFSFGLSGWLSSMVSQLASLRGVGELPIWTQVPIVYVVHSFGIYWMHRMMHTRLLWPLHAMHHATESLTALSDSREHPLENLIKSTPLTVLIVMSGFHPDAVALILVLGRLQAAVAHSQAPFPLWLERWVICGPAFHRVHHAIGIEHRDRNFGILVLWDRLFDTYSLPTDARTLATGIDDKRCDTGRPVHDMVAIARIWLANLAAEARHVLAGTGWAPDQPQRTDLQS